MTVSKEVAQHYHSGELLERITKGCDALGLIKPFPTDALAPVDEFHIGGRLTTEPFVAAMQISEDSKVLDLGCGLGGPVRYVASVTGAHVTGIDLTQEFVDVGRELTKWTGLSEKVSLKQGSVLELPIEQNTIDVAYMIHVGMNIADKIGTAKEAARVIKPGGLFSIYDVMKVGDGEMTYPAPWATSKEHSALASPEEYMEALKVAGFSIINTVDRTEFAQQFFANLASMQNQSDGPPPLGLHLIMGNNTAVKIQNMVKNIELGVIAPIEIHAQLSS